MLSEIVAKARVRRCKALEAVRSREPRSASDRVVIRSSRGGSGRAFSRRAGGKIIKVAFPLVA